MVYTGWWEVYSPWIVEEEPSTTPIPDTKDDFNTKLKQAKERINYFKKEDQTSYNKLLEWIEEQYETAKKQNAIEIQKKLTDVIISINNTKNEDELDSGIEKAREVLINAVNENEETAEKIEKWELPTTLTKDPTDSWIYEYIPFVEPNSKELNDLQESILHIKIDNPENIEVSKKKINAWIDKLNIDNLKKQEFKGFFNSMFTTIENEHKEWDKYINSKIDELWESIENQKESTEIELKLFDWHIQKFKSKKEAMLFLTTLKETLAKEKWIIGTIGDRTSDYTDNMFLNFITYPWKYAFEKTLYTINERKGSSDLENITNTASVLMAIFLAASFYEKIWRRVIIDTWARLNLPWFDRFILESNINKKNAWFFTTNPEQELLDRQMTIDILEEWISKVKDEDKEEYRKKLAEIKKYKSIVSKTFWLKAYALKKQYGIIWKTVFIGTNLLKSSSSLQDAFTENETALMNKINLAKEFLFSNYKDIKLKKVEGSKIGRLELLWDTYIDSDYIKNIKNAIKRNKDISLEDQESRINQIDKLIADFKELPIDLWQIYKKLLEIQDWSLSFWDKEKLIDKELQKYKEKPTIWNWYPHNWSILKQWTYLMDLRAAEFKRFIWNKIPIGALPVWMLTWEARLRALQLLNDTNLLNWNRKEINDIIANDERSIKFINPIWTYWARLPLVFDDGTSYWTKKVNIILEKWDVNKEIQAFYDKWREIEDGSSRINKNISKIQHIILWLNSSLEDKTILTRIIDRLEENEKEIKKNWTWNFLFKWIEAENEMLKLANWYLPNFAIVDFLEKQKWYGIVFDNKQMQTDTFRENKQLLLDYIKHNDVYLTADEFKTELQSMTQAWYNASITPIPPATATYHPKPAHLTYSDYNALDGANEATLKTRAEDNFKKLSMTEKIAFIETLPDWENKVEYKKMYKIEYDKITDIWKEIKILVANKEIDIRLLALETRNSNLNTDIVNIKNLGSTFINSHINSNLSVIKARFTVFQETEHWNGIGRFTSMLNQEDSIKNKIANALNKNFPNTRITDIVSWTTNKVTDFDINKASTDKNIEWLVDIFRNPSKIIK